MNVLVVEDDALLAEGLSRALRKTGYQVTVAADGGHAQGALLAYDFDLMILDLGLPDIDGLDVLREARRRRLPVPVLVLTARDGVEQQVSALDAGADDYMEKPFDLRELEARVRALLRRTHADFAEQIELGALRVDPFRHTVQVHGALLELPAREYEVLEALALNAPRVVGKLRLAQRLALNADGIGDNTIEVYVHRLRRRLSDAGVSIRTVRGVGYVLEALG